MISLQGLTARRGKFEVTDVSFDVPTGA